jgi:uncharacterized protein
VKPRKSIAAGSILMLARAPRYAAIGAIALYRAAISPLLHSVAGPACRFQPSCSEYARGAIAAHGLVRGGIMALKRLARCHPLGGHGYDPVPAAGQSAAGHSNSISARNIPVG